MFVVYYRPQTKLRKGNVFTPVCQSFCSQGVGVCLNACWDTAPWADTPTPLRSACWDTHPLPSVCWDTQCPVHPGIHTPYPVHAGIQCPVHAGIQCPVHAGIDMAIAVYGMYPTGIHSCSLIFFTFTPAFTE